MVYYTDLAACRRPTFLDLDSVGRLRVKESQPPTSNADGMDYMRCAALHNAIIRHAWRANGHNVVEMPRITWWEAEHNLPHLEQVQQRRHPSLVEFLKRAMITPQFAEPHVGNNFFFFCPDLAPASNLNGDIYDDIDEDLVCLYSGGELSGDCRDGIIYNQARHTCVFNEFDPMDLILREEPTPWQPLESVLSVWLDMIERGKAVALHQFVKEPPPTMRSVQPDGTFKIKQILPPEEPQVDPASGARRTGTVYNPWVIRSYSLRDLTDTLQCWHNLVQAVEDRMPAQSIDRVSGITHGLYSTGDLHTAGLVDDQFAFKFFTQARKPRCTYLGPGLRLPTPYELTTNPTIQIEDDEYPINPVCILRGDDTAKSPFNSINKIPSGLYLDPCNPEGLIPFEDGAHLVLPYDLGANGYAKKGDGSFVSGNADLYQIGFNPFMPRHPIQLLVILDHLRAYVETQMFSVNEEGVAEPADRFKEADTGMLRWRTPEDVYPDYTTALGAGERFW